MTFTIEQIKHYILSQDSLGDVLYNLTEENITKANQSNNDEEEWSEDEENNNSDMEYEWKP
jgi:glycyl-tRNA synthetase alpha subunit